MERTRATPTRPGTGQSGGYIQLKGANLDKILEPMGYQSLRSKARYLAIGVATLHGAYQGNPVGERFIFRCRTRLPKVPYERLFAEVTR